ncbi:1-phosphofructokinase family hexose kinase [Blastococcus xanthinilyticus]|uniref:1-phosphofructokinase/tagatose 6-phosphate kinase n=1 Tax=Blastococcus xanthinilyticus TaxID=1564164 RepID=A0A5S5D427_9ACTN|nr:hexose kinase [Blastococcus xanthinilyticus]TYP90465.1 1-phosphofructokinase/tagatose 6-phosphate kinase [Blastococcus xanthinilyticus]
MHAPPAGPTVHVVSPNPAQDRLQVVPRLVAGEVHRAVEVVSRPGGKGMIVARGTVRLGGRAALHGFVGGSVGAQISAGCRELGIDDRHVPIAGETRVTTVIVDRATGDSTVINEPGPEVGAGEVDALVGGLVAAVRPGDLVVCTGSLPRGAPAELYARCVTALRGRGVRTVVDTSGPGLGSAIRSGPDVLKVNEEELRADGGLIGAGETADLDTLMARALAAGVGAVVVTRGAAGLSYRSADEGWDVSSPEVPVVNATGSGDMMLAGFVTSLARGNDLPTALRTGAAAGAANAQRLEPDLDGRDEVDELVGSAVATPVPGVRP